AGTNQPASFPSNGRRRRGNCHPSAIPRRYAAPSLLWPGEIVAPGCARPTPARETQAAAEMDRDLSLTGRQQTEQQLCLRLEILRGNAVASNFAAAIGF